MNVECAYNIVSVRKHYLNDGTCVNDTFVGRAVAGISLYRTC